MGPEEKGVSREAGGERREPEPSEPGRQRERKGAPPEDLDPREEEGWSQPESSAQKLPEGGVPDESWS
jgi:hypothetical protein